MQPSAPPADPAPLPPADGPVPGQIVLVGLIVLCVGIEAVLTLGDFMALGPARLRGLAYDYGGFWAGLWHGWPANYPAQPYAMFVTYGFLHGGVLHLAVNMVTLWSLGRGVLDRVGIQGFLLLYAAAQLGGGLGFALLAAPAIYYLPMVGASGALFGLAGGLLAWAYVDRYTWQEALWPVVRTVLMLAALNLVMWWALRGQLAWETHLGGFVVGWTAALLIDPRPRDPV